MATNTTSSSHFVKGQPEVWNDEIVEETRKTREEYAARFD
jgi:hypothetical protein